MIFIDTSVWIAANQFTHPHHIASLHFVTSLHPGTVSIAAHTLAEIYASTTRMPPPERISPQAALTIIERILSISMTVTLSSDEYLETIRNAAKSGHVSGMIYDALLLACARKANADRIYTWNLRHFRALAPDLAHKILTP